MASRFYRIGRSATGLGMFATKPIKRRTYIATYRGPLLTTEEADRREKLERVTRRLLEVEVMEGDELRKILDDVTTGP